MASSPDKARFSISTPVFVVGSVLYPFVAVIGVRTLGAGAVLALLGALVLLRFVAARRAGVVAEHEWGLLAVMAAVLGISLLDGELAVRLYPVFINAVLMAAFAGSLLTGTPMIERFARLVEPDLPPAGVAYTRKVTWVWTVFFLINGLLALATVLYGDWKIWALYNGGIAYALAGGLFAGEWLVRRRVMRRADGVTQ